MLKRHTLFGSGIGFSSDPKAVSAVPMNEPNTISHSRAVRVMCIEFINGM